MNGNKGVINNLTGLIVGFFMFLVLFGLVSVVWFNFYSIGVVGLNTEGVVSDVYLDEINELNRVFVFLDRLIPLVFILLWGGVLITAYFNSPAHPVLFFMSFFSLVLLTFLSFLFVDFSSVFFTNSVFTPVGSALSNTVFFANNFHFISFGVGLVSLVIYFRRTGIIQNLGSGGFGGIE